MLACVTDESPVCSAAFAESSHSWSRCFVKPPTAKAATAEMTKYLLLFFILIPWKSSGSGVALSHQPQCTSAGVHAVGPQVWCGRSDSGSNEHCVPRNRFKIKNTTVYFITAFSQFHVNICSVKVTYLNGCGVLTEPVNLSNNNENLLLVCLWLV